MKKELLQAVAINKNIILCYHRDAGYAKQNQSHEDRIIFFVRKTGIVDDVGALRNECP